MVAKNRRITKDMNPAQRRETVEAMLREIAYVLHVTRKISREIQWPVATPQDRVPVLYEEVHQTSAAV
jgi:acetylornithine deacetylase/succinyl-diaminopimelate desuccinylase-like protein